MVDSDMEGDGCASDLATLSSNSSSLSSCFSNLSRSDLTISRLAAQLQDVQLFRKASQTTAFKFSPSKPPSNNVKVVPSYAAYLKVSVYSQ